MGGGNGASQCGWAVGDAMQSDDHGGWAQMSLYLNSAAYVHSHTWKVVPNLCSKVLARLPPWLNGVKIVWQFKN